MPHADARAGPGAEILALAARDLPLRDSLAGSGALFGGYHPAMAALHGENARRLRELLDDIGWPTPQRFGPAVVDAAWLIVQHAIAEPDFQRHMLSILDEEARTGRIAAGRTAFLEDRIRAFEGRPQLYGSQMDWDDRGELSPWPGVEAPESVDTRRATVGLPPLADDIRRIRAEARQMGERAPADLHAHRAAAVAWARSVGWRP